MSYISSLLSDFCLMNNVHKFKHQFQSQILFHHGEKVGETQFVDKLIRASIADYYDSG
jgi:hypothetical protein